MLSGIVSSFYKRIVWREEVSFPRSRGQILIQDSLPLSPAYSTQVLLKNTKPPWEEKHEKVGEVSWSQAAGTLYKQWHASRRHKLPAASSLQSQLLSTPSLALLTVPSVICTSLCEPPSRELHKPSTRAQSILHRCLSSWFVFSSLGFCDWETPLCTDFLNALHGHQHLIGLLPLIDELK